MSTFKKSFSQEQPERKEIHHFATFAGFLSAYLSEDQRNRAIEAARRNSHNESEFFIFLVGYLTGNALITEQAWKTAINFYRSMYGFAGPLTNPEGKQEAHAHHS